MLKRTTGDPVRMQSLVRVAYVLAVPAPMAVAWFLVSGRGWALMGLVYPRGFEWFATVISVSSGVTVAALSAVFLYLAYRPRWWGKIVCVFPAFAWTGFSLMSRLLGPPSPLSWVPAAAGVLLLAVAVVHHVVDPSLGPFGPAKE